MNNIYSILLYTGNENEWRTLNFKSFDEAYDAYYKYKAANIPESDMVLVVQNDDHFEEFYEGEWSYD